MHAYPETINGIFLKALHERAQETAYYTKKDGEWRPHTVAESHQQTAELSQGLQSIGVKKGDAVAVLCNTRPEWVHCDGAILALGAITVGLYPTGAPEQVLYILNHSESQILIVEKQGLLDKILPKLHELPQLKALIFIEDTPDLDLPYDQYSWQDIKARGAARLAEDAKAHERMALEAKPSDIATYIYTSGTTGVPKGVVLSHRNFHAGVQAIKSLLPVEKGTVGMAFLPFAHSLQRFIAYQGSAFGTRAYFQPDIQAVPQAIQEVKPEIFGAVPRILEKMHTRVHVKIEDSTPTKARIFNWSMGVGHKRAEYLKAQQKVPFLLERQYRLADRLVFQKVKAVLGGNLDFVSSGGAPLAPHIAEFFLAMGLLVIEGYGLTETTAPACTNTPSAFKFGTVGKPLPGTTLKIADDGEVLIKGPGVFTRYLKDEAATKKAFTDDGWFKTGDIGSVDEEGYLTITDRKKQIIITAGGKNIAPQPLENKLKGSRWISNAYVHGDTQKYLVALLTLDREEVAEKLPDAKGDFSAHDAEIRAWIDADIQAMNQKLPSYQTIKAFDILPEEFSIQGGELTPTLKKRRKVIAEKYQSTIEALYDVKN